MPTTPRLELLTPEEMGRADAAAIAAGTPGPVLMAAAGRAVARVALRRFRPVRCLVLAGPGNNGGDGYVAARLLEQAGWPVSVAALAPPRPGSDAAAAAAAWRGPMLPFHPAEAARAGLVIDAVFGAGLARDLDGPVAGTLRAARAPVLAVDVPSGLDGATGQVRGFAPRAAVTVTFFRLKPGHLLLPGRELCGELVLADIGLPAGVLAAVRPRAWRNAPGLWRPPEWGAGAHKYSRGHLTILAGGEMTGAARLAAGAAHRVGAGLVTLLAPDAAAAALYRAGDPGTIVSAAGLEALLADERRRAWLIGPGLPGDAATRAALRRLVGAGRQVVADAGALTACAGAPQALAGCAVLTPHAGEFARVFGPVGQDKLAAARAAAAATGAVVLLKGADTVIAAPDGRAAVNANAPPSLATGGTGDVLAGSIAALLAQGMEPFAAAGCGAWIQGEAARAHGPGLVAEDLITLLPNAMELARLNL
ncbi:NAD(P)H-hydrate dehydratase [Dankookia rubra]|nr:NAD(P)H-hydrate dehydratase [Dankookia rubra]